MLHPFFTHLPVDRDWPQIITLNLSTKHHLATYLGRYMAWMGPNPAPFPFLLSSLPHTSGATARSGVVSYPTYLTCQSHLNYPLLRAGLHE